MPPFRINEIAWAKIKGYPHWPARVLDPTEGAAVKVARKKNSYFVRFFSADDKNQVSWVAEEELMDFADKFAEMKQAAEVKGGKTYTDLRKCIDVASQAHQDYLEDVEKHPDLAMRIALQPREDGGAPTTTSQDGAGTSAGRGKGKASAKKETATATPAVAPRSPRGQPKPAATSAAPVPEPPAAQAEAPSSSPRRTGRGAKSDSKADSPRAGTEAEESGGPDPVLGKRVSKKRANPDEVPTVNGGGGGSARKKPASAPKMVTTPFKNPLAQGAARTAATPHSAAAAPSSVAIKQAREISVGFIGLEDQRAVGAATLLLRNGVTVRVWAKTTGLAKDLEYSGAERITDAEKIFEDADVVFMTAGSNHDLTSLLSGADHLARKIRPTGKNKIKGVCVFSSMSKEDSEATAKKMLPKNVLYLECGWVGSSADASGQSLVCCGSEQLYNHCKSVFDVVSGRTVYLGNDYGVALAAKAYLGIVEGLMIASKVEAGYMAQRYGLQLNKLEPILEGFGSSSDQKAQYILNLPADPQGRALQVMQQQYGLLRDAVHLAHPTHDAITASSAVITPLTSMTMDLFKTRFITYRCDRSDFEEGKRNGTTEKAPETASASGVSRGRKQPLPTPAGRVRETNRTFTIESGTPAKGLEANGTLQDGRDDVADNVNGEEVLDESEPSSGSTLADTLEQGIVA